MGVQLGPSFPNALPLTEARRDPRRSQLYRTIVRSPLVPPEALGQVGPFRTTHVPYVDPRPDPSAMYPTLTRPTATAAELFPRNFSRPGGGINVPGGGINVGWPGGSVRIEETTEQKVRRWLEEETFWEGVANKWFLLGGVVWWLKGRK